jgi:hypothetical protein
MPAIMPKGATHIHPVLSVVFRDTKMMATFVGISASIVADFLIRVAGKNDIYETALAKLPWIGAPFDGAIRARILRLNCLNNIMYPENWTGD